MIDANFFDECDRLAAAVLAPEKPKWPIYFTDLPADFPISKHVTAFATDGDIELRRHLKASGRWFGAGAIIAFVKENPRVKMLGTALHELAHVVDYTEVESDREPTQDEFHRYGAARDKHLVEFEAQAKVIMSGEHKLPLWFPAHGERFLRIALHFHHRAWQAGWEVGLPQMHIAGADYELSPAWRYMHALGSERKQMETATIAEITATDPPGEFIELFNRDLKAWLDDRAKREATAKETEQ